MHTIQLHLVNFFVIRLVIGQATPALHARNAHANLQTKTATNKAPTATMAADIRGVRYTGSFRIPEGGTAYPSRPGGSSLSKFPALSGDDSTIRQQFSAWDRIVQASMKAQNLSQLYDHTEYDDDEHKAG